VPLNNDRAEFVTDVTVPDGTVFGAGAHFTKTWRIKNVGATTWTTQYVLEYTVGASIAVAKQVALPQEVAPGATVDISMEMIAPEDVGDHTTLFQFRNAQGVPFGVGPRYNEAIYVKIKVGDVTPTP
jgi:Ig-like domain from next to BRCA1 gene